MITINMQIGLQAHVDLHIHVGHFLAEMHFNSLVSLASIYLF